MSFIKGHYWTGARAKSRRKEIREEAKNSSRPTGPILNGAVKKQDLVVRLTLGEYEYYKYTHARYTRCSKAHDGDPKITRGGVRVIQ